MLRSRASLPTLIILHLTSLPVITASPAFLNQRSLSASDDDSQHVEPGLRDKSRLKYEIIAIVLAYCFFTSVLFGFLLTWGRRSRRRAQACVGSLDREMVKPATKLNQSAIGVDPSPVSPQKHWPNATEIEVKPWSSPTGKQYYHHSENSMSTLDDQFHHREKVRNQDELEKLYAAVMEHDEQKASSPLRPNRDATTATRQPPESQHLSTSLGNTASAGLHQIRPSPPLDKSPTEPKSPKSPTSSRASSRLTKASPFSFFQSGHSRSSSTASQKNQPRRISVRDLFISSPMGSSDLSRSAQYNDEQPLSPRVYTPGPPPLTPSATPTTSEAEQPPTQRAGLSSRAPAPAPIQTQTQTQTRTQPRSATNNLNASLPFRQQYGGNNSSSSRSSDSSNCAQRSAPATKTTFVERRESILYPGGSGPRTGLPVPYSPYMPQTPLTPVTPSRLVTKEDRKRAKKQNGLKPLAEDELVKNDDEMWGGTWKG